jgi:hypothetical protein
MTRVNKQSFASIVDAVKALYDSSGFGSGSAASSRSELETTYHFQLVLTPARADPKQRRER